MRALISRFCDFYLSRPHTSAAFALVLVVLSGFAASGLTINSDQLSLMSPELPQVQEALKVNEMLGGFGYIIITLKNTEQDGGDELFHKAVELTHQDKMDEAQEVFQEARAFDEKNAERNKERAKVLKRIADELHEELKDRPELRFIRYKVDLDSLYKKAYFYMETRDVAEVLRRARRKRAELIEKADPFYIELEDKPAYRFDVSDIIAKYRNIGGRQMFADNYFLSPDRKMLIMLLKPKFSLNEIDRATQLLEDMTALVEAKKYGEQGVEVNFTGTYIQFLDNYKMVRQSLEPAMLLSLAGITIILVFFVRRKRLIGVMLFSLIYAIIVTFGLTKLVFSELNLLTSMFGGILAGLGIDFGIHFIFRFREEFSVDEDLMRSIKEAIIKTGAAAFFSASTTGAAFLSLIFSGFRGFYEFGVISAYGIVITATCMFLLTPLQIVLLHKYFPKFLKNLAINPGEEKEDQNLIDRINLPAVSRGVLIGAALLLIVMSILAQGVRFENDGRRMVRLDLPSKELYEEIGWRYNLAGDPLVIASDTLDEVRSLWDYLNPMPAKYEETLARVNSIYGFVPDYEQQRRNYRLVQGFHAENSALKADMVPARFRGYYRNYLEVVREKPFEAEELPEFITSQFRNLPDSKIKGWLTLVSPRVGRIVYTEDLQALEKLIGEVHYPVISRHMIRSIVDSLPAWERRNGRIKGDRTPPEARFDRDGVIQLSEYEEKGLLAILNSISPEALKKYGFPEAVNEEILKSRPFENLADVQETRNLARTTGSLILVARFTQIIERESRKIIGGTIVLVILILFISFRNVLSVSLSLIPLFCGMIFTLGVMALFDVRINYFNICVIPVVIGYGINNGIFLFHRFKETGSVSRTLYFTGSAVMASSLTTLAGWGSLSVAFHVGLKTMGYLACIGISFMMLTSLTILPAILQLLAEHRAKKAALEEAPAES